MTAPAASLHQDIRIRQATDADLPVIQAIARHTIDRSYRAFLGDDIVSAYIDSGESDRELEDYIDCCRVLLRRNTIAAFSIYFDDFIHLMMVDANHHRNGLGTLLLSHCEADLFRRGYRKIRLETFQGNTRAINFYRKNHWELTGQEIDADMGLVRVLFEKHRE